MAKKPQKEMKSIRSGVVSRSLSLAKLTVGAGSRLAAHKIGNIFSSDESTAQRVQQLLLNQVKVLAEELGQLKGSVMKVGQMLSMYGEHFLPPEVNSILKTLQYQSPPLQWRAIKKVLIDELGEKKLEELEIDHKPLASASLGQVHRATIKATKEEVVLKIQYPGVAKAIESDLKTLRRIFGMVQLVPRMPHLDELFQEVKEMLWQETDYRKELEYTNYFRKAFASDKRLIVPKTFSHFTTSKVIATSYEEGVAIDSAEVAELSQDRRNRLGEIALEVYFQELFKLGRVQTDPHLGNYKIKIDPKGTDDKIILLDFGALRIFDENFVSHYREMVRASLNQNRQKLQKEAEILGFSAPEDDDRLKELFSEFCFSMVEPFTPDQASEDAKNFFDKDGNYDFKSTDLPKRLTRKVAEVITGFKLRAPPREVVFLDRKTGGVFVFLAVLKAKLNARPLLDQFLK